MAKVPRILWVSLKLYHFTISYVGEEAAKVLAEATGGPDLAVPDGSEISCTLEGLRNLHAQDGICG